MIKIMTPLTCYEIDKQANITTRNGGVASGKWKLEGIRHVKKTNWFIPFDKLTPELVYELPILYKNGNPQFIMQDNDHGTTRIHGNTKYHGIQALRFS